MKFFKYILYLHTEINSIHCTSETIPYHIYFMNLIWIWHSFNSSKIIYFLDVFVMWVMYCENFKGYMYIIHFIE